MSELKEYWIKRSEKRVVEQIVLYNIEASSEEEAKQILSQKSTRGEIISELYPDEQPFESEDKIIQIEV